MFLQYYCLYVKRCFGYAEAESGLYTARYNDSDVDTAFDYQNMNDLLVNQGCEIVECRGYQAFLNELEPGFIFMQKLNVESAGLAGTQSTGWKFHVLIADSGDNNLERGWAILKDELIRHGIHYTKIIKESERDALKNDTEQSSKIVTVYAFRQNKTDRDWQQFIYDVSNVLERNNIQAAPRPDSDMPIKNSRYFSYRNDGRASEDPFANIDGSQSLRTGFSACCK